MTKQYIYLIHLETPIHHAQHYLGQTDDVEKRIQRHLNNTGATILKVANEQNIPWVLAAVWQTTHDVGKTTSEERDAKNQHNGKRFCPLCNQRHRNPKHGKLIFERKPQ